MEIRYSPLNKKRPYQVYLTFCYKGEQKSIWVEKFADLFHATYFLADYAKGNCRSVLQQIARRKYAVCWGNTPHVGESVWEDAEGCILSCRNLEDTESFVHKRDLKTGRWWTKPNRFGALWSKVI